MRSRGIIVGLVVLLLLPAALPGGAADGQVTITPQADGSVRLEFDSAVLGRRVTSLAWLPADAPTDGPWPVAYALHDRVLTGSASTAMQSMGFAELARTSGLLVVAPDMGDTAWCTTCAWVDGRDRGVAAETHLWDELVPIVEQHLGGLQDPRRRAMIGVGMGGTGALVQAFRHPDRLSAVGAVDPQVDVFHPEAAAALADLASQGHGLPASDEVGLRAHNPDDLAVNALATDLEVQVAVTAPASTPALRSALARWTGWGVAHTATVGTGSAAEAVQQVILPRLASTLDGAASTPPVVSYKSTDEAFSAWGWDVSVARPNREFLHLLGAHTDGADVILAGTGSAVLRSPATLSPGEQYEVTITSDGTVLPPAEPSREVVTADAGGRLTIPVQLGAPRDDDQVEALVTTGMFDFPATRVRIAPVNQPAPGPAMPRAALFSTTLPAPFDAWNVTMTPAAEHPQSYDLVFDSPALQRRVTTWVWLPDSYLESDEPSPVAYFLHGTGLGRGHAAALAIQDQLDRQLYVVVAPDAGTPLWCTNCWWLDHRTDTYAEVYEEFKRTSFELTGDLFADDRPRVNGETHLYEELIPLVEALLDVRTDRGGRAVWGHSMGASSAAHHGLRHPDRWALAGVASGLIDMGDDADPAQLAYTSYLSHQGYPPAAIAWPHYANISGLDMAPQAVGSDLEVLVTVGDGCVSDEPGCEPTSELSTGFFTELYVRQENDRIPGRWAGIGLPHAYHTYPGTHFQGPRGLPVPTVYDAYYVDAFNAVFASPVSTPERFSHKFLERRFSIWGYDIEVERPNEEFLHILGATLDGRDFRLAGTGTVQLATPQSFEPGTTYTVRVSTDGRPGEDRELTADEAGRLHLELDIGPTRMINQTDTAVDAGGFEFPQARIEVLQG